MERWRKNELRFFFCVWLKNLPIHENGAKSSIFSPVAQPLDQQQTRVIKILLSPFTGVFKWSNYSDLVKKKYFRKNIFTSEFSSTSDDLSTYSIDLKEPLWGGYILLKIGVCEQDPIVFCKICVCIFAWRTISVSCQINSPNQKGSSANNVPNSHMSRWKRPKACIYMGKI